MTDSKGSMILRHSRDVSEAVMSELKTQSAVLVFEFKSGQTKK
jgi:hypothetical protein